MDAEREDAIMEQEPFAVFGEFTFFKSVAGDDDPRPVIEIRHRGKSFMDLRAEPARKLFPVKASDARMRQFCRKFAENEAFRNAVLVKDAFSCC